MASNVTKSSTTALSDDIDTSYDPNDFLTVGIVSGLVILIVVIVTMIFCWYQQPKKEVAFTHKSDIDHEKDNKKNKNPSNNTTVEKPTPNNEISTENTQKRPRIMSDSSLGLGDTVPVPVFMSDPKMELYMDEIIESGDDMGMGNNNDNVNRNEAKQKEKNIKIVLSMIPANNELTNNEIHADPEIIETDTISANPVLIQETEIKTENVSENHSNVENES
eukprot:406007_1